MVRHDSYEHNYPHCWRTDTPIIYRAVPSWYVKVTDIKDRLVELNQEINWIPDNVKEGRFGKWLEGARDWSISRNRFWGSPIPVWKSDNPDFPRIDVYGSLDELEKDFGVRPSNLHRPFIDDLTRPNPMTLPDPLRCAGCLRFLIAGSNQDQCRLRRCITHLRIKTGLKSTSQQISSWNT